jgi:hypothetical protein
MRLISRYTALAAMAVYGAMGAVAGSAAAEPEPAPAHSLGVTEGLLTYCTKVDAASAAKIKLKAKALSEGLSAVALKQMRNSAEYRTAYESVTQFVEKVDPHNAMQPCRQAAASRDR